MKISDVIAEVNQLERDGKLNYNSLGRVVTGVDWQKVDLKSQFPEAAPDNYTRTIMQMMPVEFAILYWPVGVSSAIHFHKGFWGYVAVLEGMLDNIEYLRSDGELRESFATRSITGGVLPEPDGIIHKLMNSGSSPAVTLHIYYPPLDTFAGMEIYDENGSWAVLNEHADSASFTQDSNNFSEVKHNALDFVSYENGTASSHRFLPVIPKPPSHVIREMIEEYYSEQAVQYDLFDLKHVSRRKYTERINQIIAEEFKTGKPHEVLCMACGTGRRSLRIRELSGLHYNMTGFDISDDMVEIAGERGIDIHKGNIEDLGEAGSFDCCTFLYAFGHLDNPEARKTALHNVKRLLKPGGEFYFDVFNIEDQHEWGARAIRTFEKRELKKFGYDEGDVFYQKTGGKAICFIHYFREEEIRLLLKECGFEAEWIRYVGYTHRSGEILNSAQEGALFVKAVKITNLKKDRQV